MKKMGLAEALSQVLRFKTWLHSSGFVAVKDSLRFKIKFVTPKDGDISWQDKKDERNLGRLLLT